MIQVINLEKCYGKQVLFREASFTIAPRERIGLIGRNGHGKSTLFRILIGEDQADGGELIFPKHYRVGHLSQHLKFNHPTVLEEACSGLRENDEGWIETYKAEAILLGLGFSLEQFELKPAQLSGGFQVRLNLAKVLLSEPNLLLLDEPTNYLDIVSMRWLERFLRTWPNELMLITHDRAFMDSVTTHTVAIHRERIRKMEGSTAKLTAQILQDEEIYEKTRQNEAKRREVAEKFISRFRAQASRAKAVQSRIKLLSKQDQMERLNEIETLDFSFNAAPFPGKWLLTSEDLIFGYDKSDPLIQDLSLSIGKRDRIAVIGRNGKGKTTFLNMLAGELSPDEGKIGRSPNLVLGYFGQTNVERLNKENTVEEEVLSVHPEHSRTVVRSICGAMMFEGDMALKKIKVLSGGEKSRVLLAKILVTPANLLLLDEPTNHLDMESVDSLVEAVAEFPGAVVIVTHSEMILRALATRLVVFDAGKTTIFEGTYDEFLASRGWEGEVIDKQDAKQAGSVGLNKKEARKARAQEANRKREVLGPIEKHISSIESRISAAEKTVSEHAQLLMAIDPTADAQRFTQLSKEHHAAKTEIDKLYAELEPLHEKLESAKAELGGE